MKSLLIVEDDRVVASIYRSKFSAAGYNVRVASDGEAGILMVDEQTPDAVLLDLMLPKVSGVDILRHIRAKPGLGALPVVVFTNAFLEEQIEEAWKAGANKCLAKASATPKQVIEVVNSLVSAGDSRGTAVAPAALDPESEHQLKREFLGSLPAAMTALRQAQQALALAENQKTQVPALLELYRRVHSLTSNSGLAGVQLIARVSSALEALLRELHDKPSTISASTNRTVSQTVSFLTQLAERVHSLPDLRREPARVLAVDDDSLSLRAVIYSLERAELKGEGYLDPGEALQHLATGRYDLVILDVEMPGLSGFDLCRLLRTFPEYAHTPVIYVTALADFQSRAKGLVTGANDLIAKPFLLMELAVKSLTYVLRSQLQQTGGAS